jgi:hypothetical protein
VSTNYGNLTAVLTDILTRLQQETSRGDALAAVIKDRDAQITMLAEKVRLMSDKIAQFDGSLTQWKRITDNLTRNQQDGGASTDALNEEVAAVKRHVGEQGQVIKRLLRGDEVRDEQQQRGVEMERAFNGITQQLRANRESMGQMRVMIDALQRGKADASTVLRKADRAEVNGMAPRDAIEAIMEQRDEDLLEFRRVALRFQQLEQRGAFGSGGEGAAQQQVHERLVRCEVALRDSERERSLLYKQLGIDVDTSNVTDLGDKMEMVTRAHAQRRDDMRSLAERVASLEVGGGMNGSGVGGGVNGNGGNGDRSSFPQGAFVGEYASHAHVQREFANIQMKMRYLANNVGEEVRTLAAETQDALNALAPSLGGVNARANTVRFRCLSGNTRAAAPQPLRDVNVNVSLAGDGRRVAGGFDENSNALDGNSISVIRLNNDDHVLAKQGAAMTVYGSDNRAYRGRGADTLYAPTGAGVDVVRQRERAMQRRVNGGGGSTRASVGGARGRSRSRERRRGGGGGGDAGAWSATESIDPRD